MKKLFAFLLLFSTLFMLAGSEPLWKNLPDGGKGKKIFYLGQFSNFKEISEQDMLYFKKIQKKAEKADALGRVRRRLCHARHEKVQDPLHLQLV